PGAAHLRGEPHLQGLRVERPRADRGRARIPAGREGDAGAGAAVPHRQDQGRGVSRHSEDNVMAKKDAIVSDEMAKKFATEKETPYTQWVRSEGLEIQSAIYQVDLHTVELKPWARRGGKGVFLNHDASRTSNDAYVCEIPSGKELAPQRQLFEEMVYIL